MSGAHAAGEADRTDSQAGVRRSYDLAALVAFVVLAALLLSLVDNVLIRTLVGVPTVTFAPGYALVAALLPVREPDASDPGSLDLVERAAIAVGASVSLVVLAALVLSPLFPGGLASVPFLALLVGWTLLVASVAHLRRRRHPPEVRDGVADPRTLAADGELDLLDLLLVVGVLVSIASVGYGLAAPGPDEAHTNVTLVTEAESGEYVAAGYPTATTVDEPVSTTMLVENGAGRSRTVTVVAVLERLGPSDRVVQRSRLERTTLRVAPGERVARQLSVSPDMLGDSLRLSYYVYVGEVGQEPSPERATHHLYLWLSVTESTDDARRGPPTIARGA